MGCILKGNSGLYSRMSVGAVLLAAGAGRRLGGRPKALLELGGVPLIVRQLIELSGAGVDEVAVVLGHHADAIEPVVAAFPITLVRNPSPDEGQTSSVRIGLRALSPKLDAVMVALADQPLVNAQDIIALVGAFKKRGTAAVVVPRVDGEPGYPMIFDGAVRDECLRADATDTRRPWCDLHPDRVAWFDTANERYRFDIDTPEDLRRFSERTGHELRWPAALQPA